jgi:hypothetical protein
MHIHKELEAARSLASHKTYNPPTSFTMTPETMQAIKIVSAGKAEVQTVPVPKLRDHYILIKTSRVAINPTDWCDY